jgi:hypothetical protein
MERRLFLTGMLGVAGATALASLAGPSKAVAGIPTGNGILDELDKPDMLANPDEAVFEGDDQPDVELISHHHHGHWRRRRRRHRRRVWRRVCRRVWRHGRWHRRCWRERVWVWFWL